MSAPRRWPESSTRPLLPGRLWFFALRLAIFSAPLEPCPPPPSAAMVLSVNDNFAHHCRRRCLRPQLIPPNNQQTTATPEVTPFVSAFARPASARFLRPATSTTASSSISVCIAISPLTKRPFSGLGPGELFSWDMSSMATTMRNVSLTAVVATGPVAYDSLVSKRISVENSPPVKLCLHVHKLRRR